MSNLETKPDSIFNMSDALARCFDRQMFQQMVDFFFVQSAEGMEAMRAALAGGEPAKIAKAAHRLRGTVSYLGAQPCFDAVDSVEQMALSGDLASTAGLIERLSVQIELLKKAIAPFRSAKPENAPSK
jgi:HPt (histidine-containing phosphotransfer) domain-containing protein